MKPQTPTISGTAVVTDGTTTTLTCTTASSLTGASYVWKQNGGTVAGAVSSTYTTPSVTMSNHGDVYTCAVTFNSVTSDDTVSGLTLTGEFIMKMLHIKQKCKFIQLLFK